MSADALRTELRERLEQHGVAEKLQQSVASALTHKAAGESVELQSLIAKGPEALGAAGGRRSG